MLISRRTLLNSAMAFGATSAKSSLSFGMANTDRRLVVIMLRGGLDGLDVFQPRGDKAYSILRGLQKQEEGNLLELDSFFVMHDALKSLYPMYKSHEMAVVQAVSSPFKTRSHFKAQDLLEWGAQFDEKVESGWLNRLVGLLGGEKLSFAADIGTSISQLMTGEHAILNVNPEADLDFWLNSKQYLELLYKNDPDFKLALDQIDTVISDGNREENLDPGVSVRETARFAARMLNLDCRVATFSIYGWDTHIDQKKRMQRILPSLANAISTLKLHLGHAWENTLVLAVSEFGRTARLNGSNGTDHGTGGAAIFAGGVLANGAGGKVLRKRWPGLGDDQLFEGRDLASTDDIRRYIGWAIAKHFDLSPDQIEKTLFPGVDMSTKMNII